MTDNRNYFLSSQEAQANAANFVRITAQKRKKKLQGQNEKETQSSSKNM